MNGLGLTESTVEDAGEEDGTPFHLIINCPTLALKRLKIFGDLYNRLKAEKKCRRYL